MIKEFQGEYRWLSNFAPVNIEYGGIAYPSVEHYYVAMKTDKNHIREKISTFTHPAQAKKYGQKLPLPDYWDDNYKIKIMMFGLKQKFNQEPYKTKLLKTEDEFIQEGNWWGDKFWGVDLNTGKGKNNLGKIIMEIRETLKTENHVAQT